MVDGIRLNNAFFRNAPNQYLGLVDSFATRRMEVVRGSQGSLYGADAMGGVLNILTFEPVYDDLAWQQDSSVYGSYDSVDDGLVLNVRTQGGRRGLAFTGGASHQDHASRKSGSGARLTPSAYESGAADLKFVVDTGDHGDLMLSAQLMEQPSTPRYDELVPGFGQAAPSSEQYWFEPNRRSLLHARLRLHGQTRLFDLFEAHLARQVITDDRLSQEYGSDEIITEHNASTLDGLTLQFNSMLSNSMQLVWGGEYYTDAVDSSRYLRFAGSDAETPVASRFPDNSSMDSAAVYLFAEWPELDRLQLNTGLRYSRFDIHLPAAANHAVVNLSPADLTGDIHAIYAVSPDFKLVANIGRGFRPPNIFDLATLGPRPGNRFNIANTNLDPESVWSYDLGFKTETGDLEFEVFAFYLDYSDKITSVYTGEVTGDGRDIIRSENRNKVNIYGLEAGMYWAVTGNLNVRAVANYSRGEEQDLEGAAFPADRIPPLNGRLGLEYFINGDWRIEPYWLFASSQERLSPLDVRDPRIDPAGTDGWNTLNLLLDWQFNPALKLGLRLENITDAAYREHASGIDAAGRNIGFWVNYSFP
jgi:outer membrane receptor protein involved in Fe transport